MGGPCRFNQTYQGIQITLAYNISVYCALISVLTILVDVAPNTHARCMLMFISEALAHALFTYILCLYAAGVPRAPFQCGRIRGAHRSAHWHTGEGPICMPSC